MTTEPQAMHRQLSKSRQWEQAMNKLYINFQDYSKDARKGFNDEDIHQARVNSRKLLTLLSILDPGHTATADLYDSFKQAQKKLGRVRDADVLIGSFEARRKAAKAAGDKKTAKLLKAVIGHQKDTRKASRKKLKKALPKLSGQALEALWTPFIETGLEPLAAKKTPMSPCASLKSPLNRRKKACKTLFKGPAAETQEAFEALHELRIAAKELRYTANAAAFALDQKFHAHEAFYKDIQDQLGLINDKRVWLETLQSIGREKLDVGKKSLGRLHRYAAGRGTGSSPSERGRPCC
ncbi:CHAD domain-containing protein [Paenibacillus rhizoplanae]